MLYLFALSIICCVILFLKLRRAEKSFEEFATITARTFKQQQEMAELQQKQFEAIMTLQKAMVGNLKELRKETDDIRSEHKYFEAEITEFIAAVTESILGKTTTTSSLPNGSKIKKSN